MGLSKSKSTTTNKPIFRDQIKGAHDILTNTYNNNIGNVQDISGQITGLVPDMIQQYRDGDPTLNAAKEYNTNILQTGGGSNPYLDAMIAKTNNSVRNQIQASAGTRGQTGGSGYYDMIGRGLAENETGLRYTDYGQQVNRQENAANRAAGLSTADLARIAPLLGVADASMLPMQATTAYAAGTGGLLGQYQTQKQKSSPNWGLALLQGASNAAQAFAGG